MKSSLTFIPTLVDTADTLANDECLIFTHIPKAAGTTLDRLLRGIALTKDLQWQRAFGTVYYQFLGKGKAESIENLLSLPSEKLAQIRILTGHVPFGVHEYLPYTPRYITALRDPISRMVSHYKMGISRSGWTSGESLKELVRKGALVSDVQVRMLAGLRSPHDIVTDETLSLALDNLEKYYFLIGVSDEFERFTSALLGFLDAPNALLGEEQSARVKLQSGHEQLLKQDAEQFNRFDIQLYEQATDLARRKLDAFCGNSKIADQKNNYTNTLLASSQIKFGNNEYSIIKPDQLPLVLKQLKGKGVTVAGLAS